MTVPCQIIRLADRRPAPRPAPPPVNPYAELLALQLALVAEYLHALSAMLRGPR